VEEIELLRDLRLQALKDAPGEFGDSFEEAEKRPLDYWSAMAASLTGQSAQRMFISEINGKSMGSVFALGHAEDRNAGRLGGMWVDATARGKSARRSPQDLQPPSANPSHTRRTPACPGTTLPEP